MIHLTADDDDDDEEDRPESSDHAFGDFHGCVMNDSANDLIHHNSMMGHLLEAEKVI